MPELHFELRWPDGTTHAYYSPSTSIRDHFSADTSYTLEEFLSRARAAMHAASERVRRKYGYTCSSAMDTLQRIEESAACFDALPNAQVQVLSIRGAPNDH